MARSSRSLRNLLPSLLVLALAGCADAGGAAHGEAAAPADRAATATRAAPLVIHDGGVRIVLSRTPEDTWTTGAPTLLALDGTTLVEKDIEPAAVPAEHLAWLGERVRLVGKDGAVCEGTVETLSVLGRVMPHFATLSGWKGEDPYADDGEDGPSTRTDPPAPAVVADEAWNEAADGRLLTGILRTSGDCTGALWAQPATAAPPAVSAATDASEHMHARVVAAMRALPTYQAHQARYEEEAVAQTNDDGEVLPHAARWDETDGASTEVRVVRHGESTFVWAHMAANGGCGTFDAELGVVFAMDARGDGLRLVSDPEIALSSAPVAAADVDGDGRIELLFREGVVRSDGGFFVEEDKLDVPSHDCGCLHRRVTDPSGIVCANVRAVGTGVQQPAHADAWVRLSPHEAEPHGNVRGRGTASTTGNDDERCSRAALHSHKTDMSHALGSAARKKVGAHAQTFDIRPCTTP